MIWLGLDKSCVSGNEFPFGLISCLMILYDHNLMQLFRLEIHRKCVVIAKDSCCLYIGVMVQCGLCKSVLYFMVGLHRLVFFVYT